MKESLLSQGVCVYRIFVHNKKLLFCFIRGRMYREEVFFFFFFENTEKKHWILKQTERREIKIKKS